jgi:hypothetical protein
VAEGLEQSIIVHSQIGSMYTLELRSEWAAQQRYITVIEAKQFSFRVGWRTARPSGKFTALT